MLHRVYWKTGSSYKELVSHCINYMKDIYGSGSTVVFDGYSASTKDHEHTRREAKALPSTARLLSASTSDLAMKHPAVAINHENWEWKSNGKFSPIMTDIHVRK